MLSAVAERAVGDEGKHSNYQPELSEKPERSK